MPHDVRGFIIARGAFVGPSDPPYLEVCDEKASGTDGGGFTSGSWQTRTLNTVVNNTINGSSLGSNQITLPVGSYYIDASAPAGFVNSHVIRLRDVTNGVTLLPGSTSYSPASGAFNQTHSFLSGRFSLDSNVNLEIQHQCSSTRAADGFGLAANFGQVEIYAHVIIWKVTTKVI